MKDLLASGELVAPFKSQADPARAYFAIVSKTRRARPEVGAFVEWLKRKREALGIGVRAHFVQYVTEMA